MARTSGRPAVCASMGSTESRLDLPAEFGPKTSVSGARGTLAGSAG